MELRPDQRKDPRLFQIAALSLLLAYGMFWLDFDISAVQAVVILGTVCATQALFARIWRSDSANIRSALISGLSLCLLLRSNNLVFLALGAFLAIASKFLLRWRGKHIFNPTNFSLVLLLAAAGNHIWISAGQWGAPLVFAFFISCLAAAVLRRSERSDVALAFLAFHASLFFARSAWLGEPWSIPWHRLQNGAVLLFAFFMISDPRTTPNSRAGRLIFAALAAAGAYYIKFGLYRTNGLLWSLACCSLATPLLDWLLPAKPYSWASPKPRPFQPEIVPFTPIYESKNA